MTSKRLQKELLLCQDPKLKETGIYYFIKNENMETGTALLFGPKDTPYEYCPLEFEFKIPTEYPYVPPIVHYKTNDGITRFHPNFYMDGKVCLSILGTWSGPKWASSMNISTVLLSLYSILTSNPLQHEPSYESILPTFPKAFQYSNYVEHNLIKLFLKQYEYGYYNSWNDPTFQENLLKNIKCIKEKVFIKAQSQEQIYTLLPYSMVGSTSWKSVKI